MKLDKITFLRQTAKNPIGGNLIAMALSIDQINVDDLKSLQEYEPDISAIVVLVELIHDAPVIIDCSVNRSESDYPQIFENRVEDSHWRKAAIDKGSIIFKNEFNPNNFIFNDAGNPHQVLAAKIFAKAVFDNHSVDGKLDINQKLTDMSEIVYDVKKLISMHTAKPTKSQAAKLVEATEKLHDLAKGLQK